MAETPSRSQSLASKNWMSLRQIWKKKTKKHQDTKSVCGYLGWGLCNMQNNIYLLLDKIAPQMKKTSFSKKSSQVFLIFFPKCCGRHTHRSWEVMPHTRASHVLTVGQPQKLQLRQKRDSFLKHTQTCTHTAATTTTNKYHTHLVPTAIWWLTINKIWFRKQRQDASYCQHKLNNNDENRHKTSTQQTHQTIMQTQQTPQPATHENP